MSDGKPDWKHQRSRCRHLLKSGDDGQVWHCAVVRTGGRPVYAVTARSEHSRATHPTAGRCGRAARMFIPVCSTPAHTESP